MLAAICAGARSWYFLFSPLLGSVWTAILKGTASLAVLARTAATMNKIAATGEGFVSGWINGIEAVRQVFTYFAKPKLTMAIGAGIRRRD
jgi:hypothetical protein